MMPIEISSETMRQLCGGEFPYAGGFLWARVEVFRLENDVWEPYSKVHGILPGPALKVEVSLSRRDMFFRED